MSAILPGSTIGILGGGQLGRMMAMAARSLGYRIQVMDPDPSCPARFVVDACFEGSWDDARTAGGPGSRLRCHHAGDRAGIDSKPGSRSKICAGASRQGIDADHSGSHSAKVMAGRAWLSGWRFSGDSL